MTPAFTTRTATEQDYDTVFKIHEELFRGHIERIWGWNEFWQKERFRLNWDTCETLLIASGGECIGFTQIINTDEHLFLKNIAIIPSHQGRGVGLWALSEYGRLYLSDIGTFTPRLDEPKNTTRRHLRTARSSTPEIPSLNRSPGIISCASQSRKETQMSHVGKVK